MLVADKFLPISVLWIWTYIPAVFFRLSGGAKSLIEDGRFFSGVPVMNVALPVLALAIGLFTGIIDRGGMPVYTANPAFLAALVICGAFSGYLGFLSFIGFVISDVFFFATFKFYNPHWAYPLAILGSWIFLWQLINGFPNLVRKVTVLPEKFQVFRVFLAVPLTMAFTEMWTILAMVILRPMFLWNGLGVNMKLVRFGEIEWEIFGLHAHMLTWLAGVTVLVRFIALPFLANFVPSLDDKPVSGTPLSSKLTAPWPWPKFGSAAVYTLLMAGLFTKLFSAAFFGLCIGALTTGRSIASSYKLVAKWDSLIEKLPPLIRLILTYALAFGVSWLLIGVFRDWMAYRTLTTAAITIVFAIAVTLPLWPQGAHAAPSIPNWIKRHLPWMQESVPSLLFGSILVGSSAAFAHHCSFQPGCECLTGEGALAAMTAAAATLGATQQMPSDPKPKVYPTDYTPEELDAINKRLENVERGGVKRVYPESWFIGGGAGGKALQKLGTKALSKLKNLLGKSKLLGKKSLTKAERKELQDIANKYDTELEVYGSRARNEGRNINNKDLPVGKGKGTRSDIDVKIDGQKDIDTRGGLSNDVSNVGNGAGSPRPKITGQNSDGPTIKITPRK